jgi:hypothetical protein
MGSLAPLFNARSTTTSKGAPKLTSDKQKHMKTWSWRWTQSPLYWYIYIYIDIYVYTDIYLIVPCELDGEFKGSVRLTLRLKASIHCSMSCFVSANNTQVRSSVICTKTTTKIHFENIINYVNFSDLPNKEIIKRRQRKRL